MRKLTFAPNRAIFTFSRATIFVWMMIMATNVQSWSQCTPESNTISGTVFEDTANDGTFRSTDEGLGNVLVTAYNADGNSVGSDITDNNGIYSIPNLSNDTRYRLEFQSSNTYYASSQGEDNGSSIQFISAPACGVDYGLTSEVSSCGTNPNLILTCFVQGEIDENPNFATIISTEHQFQAASSVSALTTVSETGSIWGIAQDVVEQNLYTTAFVKQYSGLKYGPYAILKTELGGSKKTTRFVDVNDIIPQALAGLTVTEDVHDCTYGNQVGRVGLGNLVISRDSRTLYTPVLDKNLVVAIKIDDPRAEATKVFEMPRPIGIDAAEEYRIFALEWHEDLLYVGGTVTGSVSKDKSKSQAVVMTLDPATGDIKEIFRTSYLKGFWQDVKPGSLAVSHWFTDIDFNSRGEMIISFSDRIGHRYCKASTNRLDQQFPDILMVALNPDTQVWELENNGVIAGRGGSGIGNGEGPGAGEFFGFENWPTNPTYHSETALGSVFVLPESSEVIVAVYDPLMDSYSGGLHRYSTEDGAKTGAIELYSHTIYPTFGKATGFGDIIANCAVQTIEIGNYVWNDDNGNGIQDANENGIGGISLNLYDSECNLLGTTITNAQGVYAFNNSNVDNDRNGSFDGVYPNTTYYIELDNTRYDTDSGLYTFNNNEYTICTADVGSNTADLIDCDAQYNEASCLPSSFIEVNTTETNHSFDIALGTPSGFDLALTKEIVGSPFAKVGQDLLFIIKVYNQGGVSASSVTITDYLPSGYTFDPESNPGWDLEDDKLTTTITQKIIPGTNVSKTLMLLVNGSQAANYTNVAEISGAKNLAGEEAHDVDSTPDAIGNNDNGGEPFTSTDDQINDEGEIDEDDHDPATPNIFDLAVRIKLADDKYYYGGDLVKFDIELFNQGNTAAAFIKLANYYPNQLKFNKELNPDWSEEEDILVLKDENILAAGESRDYAIFFNIEESNTLEEIVDFVEIMEARPVGSAESCDFDSTPDGNPDNDTGGEIYTSTDNMIDEHGEIDEDDHDPVVVKTRYIDLALMKTAQKSKVKAGEVVTFDIEIINQGSTPAYKVDLVDYLPDFMTLVDENWTVDGNGLARRTLILQNPLTKGNKIKTTIKVKVNDDVTPRAIVNYAEIVDVKDENDNAIGSKDLDSTPDELNNNDNGGVPESGTDNTVDFTRDIDEDDHDPARIVVISSQLESSECLANATNSNDGQYEDVFKITGPSGDEWYVAGQNNYYSEDSPEPGNGALIPQPTGEAELLTEMVIMPENGMSMYTITVIRQDGDAAQLVVRSDDDEVETFNVVPESYTDIFITGDLALCNGGTEQYCVINPDPNVNYMWSQNAGMGVTITPTNANASCVDINWDAAAANADYTLRVAADDGCYAPGNYTVGIGSSAGALSCIGSMNLSLDGDCEVTVTPNLILTSPIGTGQAYNVMLTTQSGEVIPNATLTAEHIGTTVTAKIIDACSGNSCWSNILVEDKIKPTIVCQDVTISCNKVDEYEGPFTEDNCGTIASVTLLKDSLTTLSCGDPGADDFVAVIHREYQATDGQGNKSEVCTMKMFVEKVDLDDIIFPDTFLMMNNTAFNCDAYDLDMDGVADLAITGVPIYNNEYVFPDFGILCNTALTFTDDQRTINGVIKITRTWTAWRWDCSGSISKEVDQLIEIRDTEPPVITCPDNINVSAVTGDCSGTVTLPAPQISDSCSPDGLTYTIKPPFGALIKEGDSRVVTFPYSETPYDIVYTAIDGAGLSTTCTIQVTVTDNIAPVAICDQNTVVGLNSNGIGYTYALNIDDGSYDACGVKSIEIRRMDEGGPFGDKVVFTCADLGTPVVVELKVTDNGGLMNTCMANVIVQDKHAPQVTGPGNVEINCEDDYLPLSQYGDFSFTDACNVDTMTVVDIDLNSCGLGTITRTFTATDSDGTANTSQTITVVNNNPFDFNSIVFPMDIELTVNTCDVDSITDPSNLPDGFNVPQYTATPPCQMVSASPHDEMFSLIGDPNSVCFKIVRTWTVIDWCQLDNEGAPLERSGVQTISIINTKAPEDIMVTGLDDPIVSTTCDSAMVVFTATSGDCVDNSLQSLIQIDFDSDFNTTNEYELSVGGVGASITFSQMLPMGNHTAVVTFMNPCNVMTTTSFPINITNNIPPNIGCKNVAIGLEPWDTDGIPGPDTEAACINVDSLAVASLTFHMCDVDFELSFSDSSIVKELCFDCNDLGIQEVEIFAIDINGNISSCISIVDVQDNNDTDICMDIKDCVTFIQDTTVTLVLACDFQVSDNSFDLTQEIADCGPLTITHNYANSISNSTLFGAIFPLGTTVVTWTITNGLMVETCQLTVTVIDEIDPTITCGNDLNIGTSEFTGCTFTNTGTGLDPTFADNCVDVTILHDYASAPSNTTLDGATFPIGVTTVVFTVTDGNNNTATCEVVITIIDDEGPELICVADVTYEDTVDGDAGCTHTVTGNVLDPTANDECGTVATLTHNYTPAPSNTTLAGAVFPLGSTTVEFTATDNSGATSTCEVVITVTDNINPSFTCAADDTVDDGDDGSIDCEYTVSGTEFDPINISDNCGTIGLTITHDYSPAPSNTTLDGAVFPVGGPYTIIWTIEDATGNSTTCDVDIIVVDNTAPVCVDQGGPIDIAIGGDESIILTTDDLNVQYTDACGLVTVSFDPPTLDCEPEGIVDVTVTVTDVNNNTVDCPIQFNVIANVDVTCVLTIDTVYLDVNGQATIDANEVVDITGGGCGITYVPSIDISMFDCADAGNSITITILANGEECGMDNLLVLDTFPPAIVCVDDQTLNDSDDGINDCQFTVSGTTFDPSVVEPCDPSIMVNDYNNDGSLDGAVFPVGGPYTIIWTVTDANGNVSTCTHTITVVDDVDPICVDQGIIDIIIQAGETITITEDLLTSPFTDNCGVTSVIFEPDTITCENGGEFMVTATVSDAAGNTINCPIVFNVMVNDNLSCSFNIDTAYLDVNGTYTLDPDLIVNVDGGICGGAQNITLSQTFASCNDVEVNPFTVTIFVNGVECGVDSIMILDTIPPNLVCSNAEIACAEFEANFNSVAAYLETVPTNDEVMDNCEAQLIISISVDSSGLNECTHGTIIRTVVVEDPLSSTTDTCVQMITINGPADPLTQADVDGILPATVETSGCTGGGSPDVPVITIDSLTPFVDCGLFTVDFVDVSISEGCPDTINRTYTIEAICQDMTFTFVQQIIVNDTENPTFSAIGDTTIFVNPSNCMGVVDLSGYFSAMDNCSAIEDIDLTYSYEGSAEMDINTIDTIEGGSYTVTVTATDGCDNVGVDSFTLKLVDTSEVVVFCEKLVVYLDTITGLVDVSPYDALTISGNCGGNQLILATWNPEDVNDTIITMNCDSLAVQPVTHLMYIFEVLDDGMGGLDTVPKDISPNVAGVNNDCKVEIEIRDSTNVCAMTIFEITGGVTTTSGVGIPNYRMKLHGSNTDAVLSDQDGEYAFPLMPAGGNYTIATYKNDDVTNGVTTLDLIMIQRHILGLAEFDTPYKYIAADINNSENVNGSDLLALRKVILGIDIEFSNNLSWRTIDAAHVFEDPTDPWSSPIPENYDVLALSSNMYIDFLGVKIGDINGNATVNFVSENTSTRSEKKVTLISEFSDDGVSIETEEDIKVAGLQFTLLTGDNLINSISSDVFNESNIAYYMVSHGVYNISIANTIPYAIDEGDALFSIDFECLSCDLSDVRPSDIGLTSELYMNDDLEVVEMSIEKRDGYEDIVSFSVAQNNPNPWSTHTQIDVFMKQASDVTVKVFDVTGRIVHNNTQSLIVGKNTIELDNEKVNKAGVYFYEISTNTQSAQYKMIKLK
ncbi:MAG: putative repeat protein (TIGR01451 family) [Saprospiraceae bacterium]|jgi:uncharacterized repeat protein (TIGR01451 family)